VTTVEDLEALVPGEWFETPAAAADAAASAAQEGDAAQTQQEDAAPEDESPSPRRSRR
jgi:hypothetical protein